MAAWSHRHGVAGAEGLTRHGEQARSGRLLVGGEQALRTKQRRPDMKAPYFRCENCGHEFAKTEFMPDIEDNDHVECPRCGGLDIELVEHTRAGLSEFRAAA